LILFNDEQFGALFSPAQAPSNDAGVAGNHQHRSKDNEVFHFDLLSALYFDMRDKAARRLLAFAVRILFGEK
jgi:hypothetical protein